MTERSSWIEGPAPPETGASLHDEHAITIQEESNSHLDSSSEVSQMACGHSGSFLWSQSCQEVFTVLKTLENSVQPVIGLDF